MSRTETAAWIAALLLGKKATAAALGISTRELDRYVKRGDINPKMLGRRVLFPATEVARFAEALPDWEPQ